jgi:periplasmic protein TonB
VKKIFLCCWFLLLITAVQGQIPHPDLVIPGKKLKPDTTKPPPFKIYNVAFVDKSPEFPGGVSAWHEFLSKHLKWPSDGMDDTFGRVIISYIIEKDGRLTHLKVERSLGKKFDAEALRVIGLSPKWHPGRINDYPVRVKITIPINFTH